MSKNLVVLEKMCRSFDSGTMNPILSAKNAVSAIISFEDKNHPSVYCPLLGERVEKDAVVLLEYYCKASPCRKIVCPYSRRYE